MIAPDYSEERGAAVMAQDEFTVRVDLGRGTATETLWTSDDLVLAEPREGGCITTQLLAPADVPVGNQIIFKYGGEGRALPETFPRYVYLRWER